MIDIGSVNESPRLLVQCLVASKVSMLRISVI